MTKTHNQKDNVQPSLHVHGFGEPRQKQQGGSVLAAGSGQIHSKGSISRALEHLWCSQDWALGDAGLKVNQRTTRAVSEAVFDATDVSGMAEEEMCPEKENSHLKMCPES